MALHDPSDGAAKAKPYRGRIAPSPTGFLHLGHARTFRKAQERCRAARGTLILRIEDLDEARCRMEFARAAVEDLRWFGLEWQEGPDVGGPVGPYCQSERRTLYEETWERLREGGFLYPCICSRKDIENAATAPHSEDEEPLYPGTCRDRTDGRMERKSASWRFRVPVGREFQFEDRRLGLKRAVAGRDFGDFVVWRRDDTPSYQLAVVADDAAMNVTEIVRGEDLLLSTFRQLLLYEALEIAPPDFYHAALVRDSEGRRLAKRHAAMSLRALRAAGKEASDLY